MKTIGTIILALSLNTLIAQNNGVVEMGVKFEPKVDTKILGLVANDSTGVYTKFAKANYELYIEGKKIEWEDLKYIMFEKYFHSKEIMLTTKK